MQAIRDLLNRYDELNLKLCEDLAARRDGEGPRGAGQGAGPDRPDQRLGARPPARTGDGRAAPAAGRRGGDDAVGRRAAPRGAVPAAAERAGPAAARRADQPSRRRVGGLAGAPPRGLPGHRRRGHARPLLPRQRRRLDPRARSRPRHPVGGQLLLLARPEAEPAGAGREGRDQAAAHAAARAGVDPDVAARAAGQGQGAPQRLRGAAERGPGAEDRHASRSTSRRARVSATSSSRRGTCARPTATCC